MIRSLGSKGKDKAPSEHFIAGYAEGKKAAHDELRRHYNSEHDFENCMCESCKTYRKLFYVFVGRFVYTVLPDDLKEDVEEWVHAIGGTVRDPDSPEGQQYDEKPARRWNTQ